MNQLTTATIKAIYSYDVVAIINKLREEGSAELQHFHFLRNVEKHPGIDASKFGCIYLDSMNRKKPCYLLPEREAKLMIMSESLAVQTAVLDELIGRQEAEKISTPTLSPMLDDFIAMGRSLGLADNQAKISASNAVQKLTGHNPMTLLGVTLAAESQVAQWHTPTAIGKLMLTPLSGVAVNKWLVKIGMQVCVEGKWTPTNDGRQYSKLVEQARNNGTGSSTDLRWYDTVLAFTTQKDTK